MRRLVSEPSRQQNINRSCSLFLIHKRNLSCQRQVTRSQHWSKVCFDLCRLLPSVSMFSVKHFMEEGFKFIIPPPKYHPFPNLLLVLDPSSLSDKMAVETPYHRLPEDNRPSMDSLLPGDDQGLLDTDSLYDEDSPPKKGHNLKISYHPTSYIRLLVLCLFICAFAVFIASKHGKAIPATVFLGFAILRQITVLYFHLIGHCFIRIRVEIVGRKASTRNSKPKGGHPDWLKQRRIQFAIDWLIIISLIITSCIAQINEDRGWYSFRSTLVMPGCIICWVAM